MTDTHEMAAQRDALAELSNRERQEARDALAAQVRAADPDATTADVLASGADVVRSTYEVITTALEAKRAERDELDAEIKSLVEAEALWAPIVNRLVNGPARRKRSDP